MNSTGNAVDLLIDRLDKCFSMIRSANNAELEQQALIYAGFLTDIQAGNIKSDAPEISEMVGFIEQFCQLVEVELVLSK